MEKVELKTLYKDLSRRSTLVAIPKVVDILDVPGGEHTKWEIMYSIVRDSLQNFERYYPLNLLQKLHIVLDPITSRSNYIVNNFDQYLKGEIQEEDIQITPEAVYSVGSSRGYYGYSTPSFRPKYEGGYFIDLSLQTGVYYAETVCKRPFPEVYDEVTGEPTEKCAIYFMTRDLDSTYSIFNDEMYLNFCRYIISIKKNIFLQGMPIELFQGLEEDYNRIDNQLQNTYMSALTSSYWLR